MKLEPPQPPTPPSPAVPPTPPTPPRIDKTPFAKDTSRDAQDTQDAQKDEPKTSDTPQTSDKPQATPKVDRADDRQQSPPTRRETSPPATVPDTQSDYDRGKDVLREFKEIDARDGQPTDTPQPQPRTEQAQPIVPKLNYHEGHGVGFWLFTIIFVAAAAFIIVKKFLLTDKPALTKSQLFEDSTSRLKAMVDKTEPVTPTATAPRTRTQVDKLRTIVNKSKPIAPPQVSARPPVREDKLSATTDKPKPVTPPQAPSRPTKDDGKGKHFEVRV